MGPIVPYRWTPSRVALAKRLVAEGLTYRQVAEKMRSTKEAVRAVIRRERKKEENHAADLP
jgi:predicted transcriptional regulator